MISAGQETLVELRQAEPVPIPASGSIHCRMQARVMVLDNRLAAPGEADGTLTVEGLPEGAGVFRDQSPGRPDRRGVDRWQEAKVEPRPI